MSGLLKLRNLRALWTVAETGSVSQAARQLNLSQPAVTHAVKRVEAQLGIRIFERRHNGMALTPVGEIVNRRIGQVFDQLDAAERELSHLRRARPGGRKPAGSILRSINHTQLLALVEVANCKSVPYAAERIGVTEPVVYRALRELEDVLAENLFHRGTNFTPTAPGEFLVRRAKLVFAELRHMRDEIDTFQGRMAGRIIIGTLPSSRTTLVPRAIAQLSLKYPELRFSMIDEPYDDMLAGLRCGDIDVIVGSVRHPPSVKDVYEEILYLEPVSLLARAGHPLMKKSDISISDLASFGWVVPRKGVPTRDYFESLFHKRDISPPADFVETDSLIATRALLVENDRLTIISPNRAYFELRIGLLDIVPFDVSELSFQFGYTVRAQDSPPPGISEFLAALKKVGSDQCADWDVTTGMPLAATNHPRPGRLG